MSYDIGQHIDLTYLNRKKAPQKRSSQSAGQFLVEVGVQFRFKFTQSGLQAFRVVPVSFV